MELRPKLITCSRCESLYWANNSLGATSSQKTLDGLAQLIGISCLKVSFGSYGEKILADIQCLGEKC